MQRAKCEIRLAVLLFYVRRFFTFLDEFIVYTTLRHVNMFFSPHFHFVFCVDAHSDTSFRHVMRTRSFFTQKMGPRVTFDRLNDARWMQRAHHIFFRRTFDSLNVVQSRSHTLHNGTSQMKMNKTSLCKSQNSMQIQSWHDLEMFDGESFSQPGISTRFHLHLRTIRFPFSAWKTSSKTTSCEFYIITQCITTNYVAIDNTQCCKYAAELTCRQQQRNE